MSQNFKNHVRLIPVFHFAGYLMVLGGLAFALANFKWAYEGKGSLVVASLLLVAFLLFTLLMFYTREFALKAQDRAIRAEENFRHFILTGKPFDSRLKRTQIIALRFASDAEMPALAEKALAEDLDSKTIKKSIVNWRADHHRV